MHIAASNNSNNDVGRFITIEINNMKSFTRFHVVKDNQTRFDCAATSDEKEIEGRLYFWSNNE
jgi:hypothetical protein